MAGSEKGDERKSEGVDDFEKARRWRTVGFGDVLLFEREHVENRMREIVDTVAKGD